MKSVVVKRLASKKGGQSSSPGLAIMNSEISY